MDTMQQMTELLLKNSLEGLNEAVSKKLEETEAAFNAKLDGLKVSLNERTSVLEAMAGEAPLSITLGTVEEPKTKIVHTAFMKVLNILKSQKRIQKNIMFVGEAGSGKTHLAGSLADAMGLKFYPMSVGLQTTKSDLLGFINAHGQYVTSPIREAFEKGGVLLLDEFDSAHAGVVTIINSLLANGHCSFPDKIVEKHPNFICIVACNTYGHGANIDYVGRNRLDGATLDRFIVVDVGYDKRLEKQLTNNQEWLDIVEKIRKNVQKHGVKMIISPRASMNGADLLDAGFDLSEVIDMCILKGADTDTRKKCLQDIEISKKSEIETKSKDKYVRNTDKYLTIEIRTEDDNFDNFIYYRAIKKEESVCNFDISGNGSDGFYHTVHFGWNYAPEFDSDTSIFFSTKANEEDDTKHYFKEFEKEYITRAMLWLDEKSKENWDGVEGKMYKPVCFEFIEKGCRNPYKTLVVDMEEK